MSCSLVYGEVDLMQEPFSAQVGTSLGAWKSITSETSSLFLDGAVVSGDSTGNRQIVLSVRIEAGTRAEIIAASELLIGEANRGTNVLVWTHDDGTSPVVYETFRTVEPKRTDDESEAFLRREYELTIPALPFARSNVRRTPALSAPSLPVLEWSSSTQGASKIEARAGWPGKPVKTGSTYLVDTTAAAAFGGVTVVSNASMVSVGSSRQINSVAAGLVVVRSTSTIATSANSLVIGMQTVSTFPATCQVGVEWFNGSTSLGVDWGARRATRDIMWAASARPSSATNVGYRIRYTATAANQGNQINAVYAQAGDFGPVANTFTDDSAPFVSKRFLSVSGYASPGATSGQPAAGWAHAVLQAPVDISSQPALRMWLSRSTGSNGGSLTVRVHSAGGKWSEWDWQLFGSDATAEFPPNTWKQVYFALTTPSAISESGAATLTAVTAFSYFAIGQVTGSSFSDTDIYYFIGDITAGPVSGATTSPRGTLFVVDTIVGSARSPAAVHASSSTALTDVVLQAVDPDDGPPLLAFVSSVATAAAPHGYDGVYSIIGTRISGTDPVAPVLTITQKVGSTTIAARALDGVVRPGGHYVDFGSIGLPLVAAPDENIGVSLTFAVTPTSASWGEVLVLNTNSPLTMLDQISPTAKHVFVDEPAIETGIGRVWTGNNADRTDAQSPINPPTLSLPFTVRAPGIKLFAYSTANGPSIALGYWDRWLVEPV